MAKSAKEIKLSKLSGPEKAAIVMIYLGEDAAAGLIAKLSDEEVKRLGYHIARMQEIPSEILDEVLMEFKSDASGSGGVTGGADLMRNLLGKARGSDADKLLDELQSGSHTESISQLVSKLDASTFANYFKNEHPQTLSLVLSHIDSAKAAEIIKNLPEEMQSDVVMRIARLTRVSSEMIHQVEQALSEGLGNIEVSREELGGVDAVVNIVNSLGRSGEKLILDSIEERDPELVETIRKRLFTFEDLLKIENSGIQLILREVNNETLRGALKTASQELRGKIFANMSKRAAQMVQEELEMAGPMRLSEVEAAQQTIANVARKLEDEGRIVIGGAGSEGKADVFV